jgi:hypothetical protein
MILQRSILFLLLWHVYHTNTHPTTHTHTCEKLQLNDNVGGKLFYSTTVMVITIIYVEHISIYKKEHLIN